MLVLKLFFDFMNSYEVGGADQMIKRDDKKMLDQLINGKFTQYEKKL